jgi:signal transduction histidine kinase/CheY-like chemotaxis protein
MSTATEEGERMKEKQNLDIKLFVGLLIASLLTTLLATILTARSASHSTDILVEEVRRRMEASAVAASILVPYERLAEIQTKEDAFSPEGEALRTQLIDFAQNMNLLFVYYIKIMPNGGEEFVIDNDTNPETVTYPGVPRVPVDATVEAAKGIITSNTPEEVDALDFEAYTEYFQLTDEINEVSFLSAYAPIYAPDGSVAYLAGVDGLRYNLSAVEDSVNTLTGVHVTALVSSGVFWIVCMLLFRRRAKLSEEASRAKSSFLSSMSHEIRTPLNTIIGMTDIALRGDDVRRIDCLKKITFASEHLLSVINDILDISKIEENKLVIAPRIFLFRDFMDSLTGGFSANMASKGQDFFYETDGQIPPSLYADDQRLTQVLLNLLSNALKFTPKGGRVTLKSWLVWREEDLIRLGFSVTDTGIGISPEVQEKIFRPFEQADASTTRTFGGTGLGLAICRSIVEAMDGEIGVESEPGKGSQFYFEVNVLVAPTDAAMEAAGEADDDGIPNFEGKTILVVDDVEINREIVAAMLEETHASLTFAANGREAVDTFFADERIDVILMDVQMPVMSGLLAAREIRAADTPRANRIPIIALTANALREDFEECVAAGMNTHIGKPIIREVLLRTLRRTIPS